MHLVPHPYERTPCVHALRLTNKRVLPVVAEHRSLILGGAEVGELQVAGCRQQHILGL